MELQAQSVVRAAGEQLQVPLTTAEDPAERHLNKAEDELFHMRGRFQTESLVGSDLYHLLTLGAAFHRFELGVLHRKAAQVTPDGVRAAEAVVEVCLESHLPEEVHIFQHFAAAHEDGREILNHVGIGEFCVYSLDTQHLVNQSRLTGRPELADDIKNSAEAVDLLV